MSRVLGGQHVVSFRSLLHKPLTEAEMLSRDVLSTAPSGLEVLQNVPALPTVPLAAGSLADKKPVLRGSHPLCDNGL